MPMFTGSTLKEKNFTGACRDSIQKVMVEPSRVAAGKIDRSFEIAVHVRRGDVSLAGTYAAICQIAITSN